MHTEQDANSEFQNELEAQWEVARTDGAETDWYIPWQANLIL